MENRRKTHPLVALLAVLFGIGIIGVFILAFISGSSTPSSQNHDSLGRPLAASVTNDADLLLSRCGRPDADISTENDSPRPPIPTRLIEYRKQRVKVVFVPGGQARVNDPPPYQWKLMGVFDPKTKKTVNLTQAAKRLPCWTGK
jgi:hypothetical protein